MTFLKVLILTLNVLLMLFAFGIGQEEIIIDEEIMDKENFTDSIYTTCDFDLENIETLLQYLPAICTEIYNNRTTDKALYDLYMEESQNFAKFYKKLDDYELRSQPNNGEELLEYPFETKLRNMSYTKIDLGQCIITANTSATDYLNCVKAKRLELLELIPSVNAKLQAGNQQ